MIELRYVFSIKNPAHLPTLQYRELITSTSSTSVIGLQSAHWSDWKSVPHVVMDDLSTEEELVKTMVGRFLGWRLPDNFSPDAGISFDPNYNVEYMAKQGKPPMRHEPVGTNLFDIEQAEEMVRHMLGLSV